MTRAAAILALVVAACGGGSEEGAVRVFAASSLTDAFTEIEAAFEAANPGVGVELNFAGSSALREQVLEGAPADVFAVADESTMGDVVAAGEASGEPAVFARNRLVIGVPAGNPAGVGGLTDLADDGLLVGLCAVGVPCGDLAREVLRRAGVEAAVDTNEPNVRALTAKIADAELDVGLIYVTDVVAAGDVTGLPIPEEADVTAPYPIVTLAGAAESADLFVAFVLGPEGQEILSQQGFGSP